MSGLGSIDNKRTALAMQVQEYKMKNDMQIERLNGMVGDRDTQLILSIHISCDPKLHPEIFAKVRKIDCTICGNEG